MARMQNTNVRLVKKKATALRSAIMDDWEFHEYYCNRQEAIEVFEK